MHILIYFIHILQIIELKTIFDLLSPSQQPSPNPTRAAFQFGVKMSDGRKTRRVNGSKDDKAHLDKEWEKIQSIIEKRKK